MPWLPLYLDHKDLQLSSQWLSSEEDIALIESAGPGDWKAVLDFEISKSGRYCLFHKNSGPLPLLTANSEEADEVIVDPFKGWSERRAGANPSFPYFGAGHPAIYWLNVRINPGGQIGFSSFEWIGNHYSIIGQPAPEPAKRWWNRLRRWVKKNAERIPRSGSIEGAHSEVWAFPAALEAIKSGVPRARNP